MNSWVEEMNMNGRLTMKVCLSFHMYLVFVKSWTLRGKCCEVLKLVTWIVKLLDGREYIYSLLFAYLFKLDSFYIFDDVI